MLGTLKNCPNCGKKSLWDNMIWLSGKCLCPQCYYKERQKQDKEKNNAKI